MRLAFVAQCTDLVVVCVERHLGKKHVSRELPIDKDFAIEMPLELELDYPNSFRLRTPQKVIDLQPEDEKAREVWLRAFETCAVDQNITDASEGPPWNRLSVENIGRRVPDWIKDKSCAFCMGCNQYFATFNRRHHCRFCGGLFCSKCAGFEMTFYYTNSNKR